MKQEYIEAGKIVGTHGIRGMVRIQVWADDATFLSGFKTLYCGQNKLPVKISKIQSHKNVSIALIDGVDSIEKAEKFRNKVLYIKRCDADIPEDRYFVSELIGCRVFDSVTNEEYGEICDVSKTGANDVWHIKKHEKEYLLPAISDVVKRVDIDNEVIEISPMKGIFDDEN